MSEGYRADHVVIDEAQQLMDDHFLELLQKAIPSARPVEEWVETELTSETIYATIEKMRRSTVPELPTWVVPLGTHVDVGVPANVVHSPLVGPDYFVVIPVDAFDPHPFDA